MDGDGSSRPRRRKSTGACLSAQRAVRRATAVSQEAVASTAVQFLLLFVQNTSFKTMLSYVRFAPIMISLRKFVVIKINVCCHVAMSLH